MKPVALLTHLADPQTGLIAGCLEDQGCVTDRRDLLDGGELPDLAGVAGIVALGGRQSATELERHPYLVEEVKLLRRALDEGVPVLGICLGSQLLSLAAGGTVGRIGTPFAGWPELVLTPEGRGDPLFGDLPDRLPVLKWHEDMVGAPPTAAVLGTTESPGVALYRVGPAAWGSQMHLEVTPEMLFGSWLTDEESPRDLANAGRGLEEFRDECERHLEAQMTCAKAVFARFGGLVAGGADRGGVSPAASAPPLRSRA